MAAVPPTADAKETKRNIFRRVLEFFKHAATWIPEHLGDPAIVRTLREDLGLAEGADMPADKQEKFKRFAAGLDPDKAAFAELLAEIKDFLPLLKSMREDLRSDELDPFQVDHLLLRLVATDFVRLRAPTLYAFSRALLFLSDDIESLALIDPAVFLHQVYGEDLPETELMMQRLGAGGALALQLFDGIHSDDGSGVGHVDATYGWDASPGTLTPQADLVSMRTTTIRIGQNDTGGGLLASFNFVPAAHGGPGFLLSLGGAVKLVKEPPPLPQVIDPGNPPGGARYELDAGVGAAFNLFLHDTPNGLALDVDASTPSPFVKFSIAAAATDTPALRLGEAGRTRLDIYDTELGIRIAKDQLAAVAALRNAELVIGGGEGDSFLRRLVGKDGVKLRFSVGLVADTDGLHLDGGTRAAVTLPLGRSIAGLMTIHHVELGIGPAPGGGDFALEIGGAFTANLGPVAVAVDGLGFVLTVDRRGEANNLGAFHLALGHKAPHGLGFVVKGKVIRGGGYLDIAPSGHEYSGALELAFGNYGLKAIGMLGTGPGDDWSLLLLLYVQFPLPVGAGFYVYGVGGLLGLQHGADLPALIAGMKTKAFDDILFPADVVADAPRILNRLRTLFPRKTGTLTFAPMVDLGWGSPRFVFLRIGLLVQIDQVFGAGDASFSRAALIGQLKVALGPSKEEPDATVVQLVIDVLGFWDREQKRYGVVARLRDSKIAIVAITGSLMVYGEYGANQRFLLAAGGFNPRFKDLPAGTDGVLDRLGAAFEVGRFKLAILCYFAISPGTIQCGLDIACSGKIGPVGLKGQFGFDALIYREPTTHFIVDFRLVVEVSYKGHTLAGVKCIGTIEGPGLWHLVGKVTFSILFLDIDKPFDESWGHAPALELLATDVKALLAAEMQRVENWTAQLPAGTEAMVSLAPLAEPGVLFAHPLGRALFTQRVVPLGLALQRYGSTRVGGPAKFELTGVKIGGATVPLAACPPVQEHFARAQFLDMSEDDKLAKPSFEPMDAGVEFSSTAFHPSASVLSTVLDYETAYLDFDEHGFNPTRADTRLKGLGVDHALTGVLARRGPAARAPQRHDERQAAKTRGRVTLAAAPLAAATRDTFAAEPALKLAGAAQRAVMLAEQRVAPAQAARVQMVESFELA